MRNWTDGVVAKKSEPVEGCFSEQLVGPIFISMRDSNNQRSFDRIRQRVSCVIKDDTTEHLGFVTDVSPSGLFLQTRAKLVPGRQVIVDLGWNGELVTLTGVIARVCKSNRSAAMVNASGFGFEIQTAPETYYQMIMDLHPKPE